MFTWVKRAWLKLRLFRLLRVDGEQGAMYLRGTRVFLPPTTVLSATRNRLIDIGPAAQRFMYEAGKEAGSAYAEATRDIFRDIDSPEAFVQACQDFATFAGWGRVRVVEQDFDRDRFSITLENGFIETEREEQTCEYVAGVMAGTASVIRNRDMDVREEACENAGADRCRFSMRPADEFDSLF